MEILIYIWEAVGIVLIIAIPMFILNLIWYVGYQIWSIYKNKPTMKYIEWNKYMANKLEAEDSTFED